ncbi:ATP-grasp fold amidoligase family protein [Lentimicrobium sp.]
MKLAFWRNNILLRFNPKVIANKSYKEVFGRNVNWENPGDLVEKILWLQLYSDTTLWTRCADKYRVRRYVEEKGCGYALNELYGKWDKAEDIDWAKLPDSFVLKANNSCGEVLLVKDKSKLDIAKTTEQLNRWLGAVYGQTNAQLHYSGIQPCIIAEKLMVDDQNYSSSLIDYKIWCFHGIPECVLVAYDRTEGQYYLTMYDLKWNNISSRAFNKNDAHYGNKEIPQPKSFGAMLEIAKILSRDIPQVRMDFYDVDGKAVFGEMTFTTGFGSYAKEFYQYLGSKIDLSKVKKLDKPNTL